MLRWGETSRRARLLPWGMNGKNTERASVLDDRIPKYLPPRSAESLCSIKLPQAALALKYATTTAPRAPRNPLALKKGYKGYM